MTNWIDLTGLDNLRDLGGTKAAAGIIAPGRLWRSDNLQTLAESDVTTMRNLGLREVIDLRSAFERQTEGPTRLTGADWINYYWLSLIPEPESTDDLSAKAVPLPKPDQQLEDPIADSYIGYIVDRPAAIVSAMRVVAGSDGAALVHCAAGKDRTGTVIALILSALGVDRSTVIADYVVTSERIGRVVARMRQAPSYQGNLGDLPDEVFFARAEVMSAVLAHIDGHWGGVPELLAAMGWTAGDQHRLEERLLD